MWLVMTRLWAYLTSCVTMWLLRDLMTHLMSGNALGRAPTRLIMNMWLLLTSCVTMWIITDLITRCMTMLTKWLIIGQVVRPYAWLCYECLSVYMTMWLVISQFLWKHDWLWLFDCKMKIWLNDWFYAG